MATMTRFFSVVFGVFFLIISLPMVIGGVAVLSVPQIIADDQGYMNAPTIHLQSDDSYAFVTESFTLDSSSDHQSSHDVSVNYEFDNYGKIVNFRVMAESYFLGLAPTSDVQQYLGNVPYKVVNQMKDQSITTYSVNADKNGSLSSNPTNQSFWIASGTDVLYYTPSKDDFNKQLTFVVMKADGSQGVDTNVKIGVDIPILQPIGIGLVVIGSILFVLTVALFVIAYKSKETPKVVQYYAIPAQQQLYPTPSQEFVESASKYCLNCGTQTDLTANFCETCGFAYKKE